MEIIKDVSPMVSLGFVLKGGYFTMAALWFIYWNSAFWKWIFLPYSFVTWNLSTVYTNIVSKLYLLE